MDNEESEQAHLFLAPDFACLQAQRIDLLSSVPSVEDMDYKTRIASRVAFEYSCHIPTDIPLTQRVHKFPDSINRLSDILTKMLRVHKILKILRCTPHIFRSPRDEMSYIPKQIMRERMRTRSLRGTLWQLLCTIMLRLALLADVCKMRAFL